MNQHPYHLKHAMKKFLLICVGLLSVQLASAQFPISTAPQRKAIPGTADDNTPKGNSKITGFVVDSAMTKAVEFASVALVSKTTNKPVDGAVADDKGKFTLNKVLAGDYKLLFTFIGYENKTVDGIKVEKGKDIDLGVVKLSSKAKTLEEVTVTGQKDLIEEKVDRLVYNAEKDITAKGGDASDVLRKVPMLSVDLQGNVSLRGSSNIRVLINNKPSTIVAGSVADALKQIPADMIKSVEVITSPSAKYDAEGSGGIINIITKKNTLQGLSLNVDAGVGNRGSNLSLNGSYRKGKMGFSLGGFGRANYNLKVDVFNDQTNFGPNGNTSRTIQNGTGKNSGQFGNYNLGFDYDMAKNQSLTAGVRYGVRNMLNTQDYDIQSFVNGNKTGTLFRDIDTKNLSGTVDVNVDYLHTYKKPQQEWSISTMYSRNDLTNNYDANDKSAVDAILNRQKNINHSNNQEATLQTDYQTPIRKNQLIEFGAKGIMRKVSSNYDYLYANAGDPLTQDPKQPSGALDYDQNVVGGYTSYTYTTKSRYTLKAGARYEHTSISASTREGGEIHIPNYGNLVPSVNLSKSIKGTMLKLGYNRRIQRPGIQQLNPNINAANPQNISIGNPLLRPELTDNIELGASRTIKKFFLNATFFGRKTDNMITQVVQSSDTLAGGLITTYQNIGSEHALGSNIFGNLAVSSKINIGIFSNFLYSQLKGKAPIGGGISQDVSNSGLNVSGGFFTQFTFKNGWGAQGFAFLQGSQVQLQGRRGGFGFYSAGVKKDFKNKKGSIGLAGENFLTKNFHMHTQNSSPQFTQVSDIYIFMRGVRLTFTYKIGKMTMDAPRKKGKSVNNDDVKTGGDGMNQQQGGGTPSTGTARPR
ncbi:Outer membrane receptor proteins, mostly Fe transport [Siphonobacter aquaeclarae]|uniref:Outer membrane receptor proteins, mostly Fe transport n=2 Tax=Siphonobacter aquaeclarae TaxID=563176 RepID=A0A1G9KQS8_9BACT|nr:Outer membrane receptor proteins, mostly Fe transport [Siphonobacter aquaeclarae]